MGNICGKAPANDQQGKKLDNSKGPMSPLDMVKNDSIANSKNFRALKDIDDIKKEVTVGKILGQGAFGKVYRCKMVNTGDKEFAMKTIDIKSLSANSKLPVMLQNELQVLTELSHPHIMNVIQLLKDSKRYYIITELMEGGELWDLFEQREKFCEKDAVHIIKQVLQALNHMHGNNYIHRDLKPQNILLVNKSNSLDIKLADFGFSCLYDPKDGLDTFLGSPLYMAPEIINKQVYNEKVDVWAVAVIAYMLLSGDPPFPAESKEDMKRMITNETPDYNNDAFKKISKAAKKFLQRGLQKDQTKRPSAAELLQDPWITKLDDHSHQLNKVQMKGIFKNLKKFEKTTSFQKTITSILINLVGDQCELAVLEKAFQQIDTNNDGNIDANELKKLDSDSKWKDIINKLDLDGDGQIGYQEFLAAAIDQEKLMTDEHIKMAFKLFDTDGDGKISVNEFYHLMTNSKDQNVEHTKNFSGEKCKTDHNNQAQKDGDQKWNNILKEIDTNGDGVIDFEEFRLGLHKMISQTYTESSQGEE